MDKIILLIEEIGPYNRLLAKKLREFADSFDYGKINTFLKCRYKKG